MKLSIWQLVWKSLVGGGAVGVWDYCLGLLKNMLAGLGDATKDKITAVLNFAMKILAVAKVIRIFIPVKWQIAYELTVIAIERIIAALQDLNVTGAELQGIIDGYNQAYAAWMGPDDETCIDVVDADRKELA